MGVRLAPGKELMEVVGDALKTSMTRTSLFLKTSNEKKNFPLYPSALKICFVFIFLLVIFCTNVVFLHLLTL